MSLSTQPYKGARDFYPEQKRLQKYMFGVIRDAVEKFGYEEYDAPLLEPLQLYAAKTGDEIVNEQTYVFTDRGGREIVIRPEMTPSVSRMVAARRQELAYPLRWYSLVDNWRYERPQRGRNRQFYQLNIDLFGVKGVEADHEVIAVADAVVRAFGTKRDMYTIKLNSRKLVDRILLDYLELNEAQIRSLMKLIDRMPKMEPAEFVTQADMLLTSSQREAGIADKLHAVLRVKSLTELPNALLSDAAALELDKLIKLLKISGVTNVEFDITIARGFDYYTDIVFEVFDNDPQNKRSMFGGGRYDGLVGLFGVAPLAAVGFAMGDVTLENFLETHGLLPELEAETELMVASVGEVYEQAVAIAAELRKMGLNVAFDFTDRKPEAKIRAALKKGIRHIMFIGEKELANKHYIVRDLQTGKEEKHSLERTISLLKDYRR